MPPPSRPADELQRLEALRRYDILDTPPEEGFDRVTRLAARWLDVPIALVTLLDEDRQWFKSCVGLELRETDREISFCAHNVHDESIMIVEDATADPRFADNPLVTGDPGIRFYAGAPLVTDGHVLGSLCVIDTVPRSADTMDLDVLCDLADMVVTELELRAANDDLRAQNEKVQTLTRELKRVQETDRSQIAQILYEELQQSLQAARMTLENACDHDTLSASQIQRFNRVTGGLDDALDVTRTLAARFAPPVSNQPLRDTFEWLAQRMRDTHGLSISVLGDGAVTGASETLKTLLYRLVRELLFRIVRRVDPDEGRVHLIESVGHLRITVEGDGQQSFDPFGSRQEDGDRLTQLRTQLEALGGTLHTRSCSGAGTCITIELPRGGQPSTGEQRFAEQPSDYVGVRNGTSQDDRFTP